MARVAVDAMGGDHAPEEIVAGALQAARRGFDVVLVGDESRVAPLLGSSDIIPIVHAPEYIQMGEPPARAIREKPDASINVAARLVRDREADALVSAGSTGAAITAAALTMGRIPGVRRPAIASSIPTIPPTVLVDAGANLEVDAERLLQFALMGCLVSEIVFDIDDPRVGLLSIGSEPGKGRPLEKDAAALLAASSLRFIGNIEGRDITGDSVDVVVTDGFTGNVALKVIEGTARWVTRLAAEAGTPLDPVLGDRLDYETTGGAHLVGMRGVVVIAHGSSSRVSISNAIEAAAREADGGFVAELTRRLG